MRVRRGSRLRPSEGRIGGHNRWPTAGRLGPIPRRLRQQDQLVSAGRASRRAPVDFAGGIRREGPESTSNIHPTSEAVSSRPELSTPLTATLRSTTSVRTGPQRFDDGASVRTRCRDAPSPDLNGAESTASLTAPTTSVVESRTPNVSSPAMRGRSKTWVRTSGVALRRSPLLGRDSSARHRRQQAG